MSVCPSVSKKEKNHQSTAFLPTNISMNTSSHSIVHTHFLHVSLREDNIEGAFRLLRDCLEREYVRRMAWLCTTCVACVLF